MSAIQQAIIASAGGGAPAKTVEQTSIYYTNLVEGQQQTVQFTFNNWDSSRAYWTVVSNSGGDLSSQVTPNAGYIDPGTGGVYTINFTFNADATTDGNLYYYINLGSSAGQQDYAQNGTYLVRDTSQAHALILDLDPASMSAGGSNWTDSSGAGNNAGIYNYTYSTDNSGTLVLSGSSSCEVSSLNSYGMSNLTFGIWMKPTAVTGINQTLIAKELAYKLRITVSGDLQFLSGDGYSWNNSTNTTAGGVNLTGGQWRFVTVKVDPSSQITIYVDGQSVGNFAGTFVGSNGNPFDIGMWQTTGSPQDQFVGSIGKVKVWNYALTDEAIAHEYNTTASRYGLTPIPLSLNFAGSGITYLLAQNTQSDWNLGNTYTIEFWMKAASVSTGTIRTIASQGPGTGIDVGYAYQHLLFRGSEPIYPEPTPGVWTHVAYVGEGDGYTKLYYNGAYETNWTAGPLNDGSTDLAIGRRGPTLDLQYFYGKLAMLRISNTAKYTTGFTPSVTYGVESDTKLLLGKTDPFTDATNVHPIDVHNVTASVDFPVI